MACQSLSSEKFLLESLQKEQQLEKSNQLRRAKKTFLTNILALIGVSAAVYGATVTMPKWLPVLVNVYYRWMII